MAYLLNTETAQNGLKMFYTLDFRLRDFYKEDYTWTIWNNKGDARMATIFSGGVGYKW